MTGHGQISMTTGGSVASAPLAASLHLAGATPGEASPGRAADETYEATQPSGPDTDDQLMRLLMSEAHEINNHPDNQVAGFDGWGDGTSKM